MKKIEFLFVCRNGIFFAIEIVAFYFLVYWSCFCEWCELNDVFATFEKKNGYTWCFFEKNVHSFFPLTSWPFSSKLFFFATRCFDERSFFLLISIKCIAWCDVWKDHKTNEKIEMKFFRVCLIEYLFFVYSMSFLNKRLLFLFSNWKFVRCWWNCWWTGNKM